MPFIETGTPVNKVNENFYVITNGEQSTTFGKEAIEILLKEGWIKELPEPTPSPEVIEEPKEIKDLPSWSDFNENVTPQERDHAMLGYIHDRVQELIDINNDQLRAHNAGRGE